MSPDDADRLRTIVHRVRRGDRDAFGMIVSCFEDRLLSLARMIVRDAAAAEEIVQDAFVRAYVHFARYDDRRPLYPRLATMAVRLSQNWSLVSNKARSACGLLSRPFRKANASRYCCAIDRK